MQIRCYALGVSNLPETLIACIIPAKLFSVAHKPPRQARLFFSASFVFPSSPSSVFFSTAQSQNTTIRLPLLQILLAINRSLRLRVLPVLRNLLNALCDERRQLRMNLKSALRSNPTNLPLFPSSSIATYVEIRQIRAHIRAHLAIVDYVASVLGVSSHAAGAVAFVEVFAGLLGGERQAADTAAEGRGGVHGCGCGV